MTTTSRRFAPIDGICMTLLALAALLWSTAAAAQPRPNITASLVADRIEAKGGGTATIAILMKPAPGWHGYWKNPGDAGIETQAAWTLPQGMSAGPIQYPVPETLLVGGLMNHVYEGEHALLVDLKLPPDVAAGARLPVTVKLDWLACTKEVCVPESGTLQTILIAGSPAAGDFAKWRAALPRPLIEPVAFAVEGGKVRIGIPLPASVALDDAHFFPLTHPAVAYAAPQSIVRDGDRLVIETTLATGANPDKIEGLLRLGDGRGLMLTARPGAVPAASTGSELWSAIMFALGGAMLGGLILNIMPCVFPILSLKAMSLAKAGGDERAARRDALGYTLGAIGMCVALGGALLALRAGGNALGWAFQLQDPRVIVLLQVLSTAIALNFAGLFELPSIGGGIAGGNSIATGALAAFVATPCTGPFMGAALGAALVLPTAAALAIFAGLGLGLAFPFLLLGYVPALRRRLPKPGAWMNTFRHLMSVPMFATALALLWLLGRLAGVDAAAWGAGAAIAIGLVLWWAGMRQGRGVAIGVPIAALLVALTVLAPIGLPRAAPTTSVSNGLGAEPFSETRLAALQAEGRPIFVYFTADWCVTCKVNEGTAIERAETAAAFAKSKTAVLVGDWTRGDAEITRFLATQGRSGVPLYLYYPAGSSSPKVLPQVLTVGILTSLGG